MLVRMFSICMHINMCISICQDGDFICRAFIARLNYMIELPRIDQAKDISGKRVFVRGDIDAPLQFPISNSQFSKITDDTRLKDIWPTIEYLLKQNCQVVLAGHLGRPGGKVVPELSGRPVAEWFSQKMSNEQSSMGNQLAISDEKIGSFGGFRVSEDLAVLENLRFDSREEKNDEGFAREVASMVGVAKLLPHYGGFRLAKEVEVLSGILENPRRPLVVVIGGAKLETKLPVISKMAEVADFVIVGGKLLSEIIVGSPIMAMEKVKLLRQTENGKDCTLESIDRCQTLLQTAGTIVWNGPVGRIEDINYQVGTKRLAELIVGSKSYKVIGGGDTVGFGDKLGLTDKFDWVSSGGGSMLRFLAGEELPGITALLT